MLSMLREAEGHVANHVIIENIFIKKVRKQLFLTKFMMRIILRGRRSYDKWFIKVQKDQQLFSSLRLIIICK